MSKIVGKKEALSPTIDEDNHFAAQLNSIRTLPRPSLLLVAITMKVGVMAVFSVQKIGLEYLPELRDPICMNKFLCNWIFSAISGSCDS